MSSRAGVDGLEKQTDYCICQKSNASVSRSLHELQLSQLQNYKGRGCKTISTSSARCLVKRTCANNHTIVPVVRYLTTDTSCVAATSETRSSCYTTVLQHSTSTRNVYAGRYRIRQGMTNAAILNILLPTQRRIHLLSVVITSCHHSVIIQ